MKVNKLFSLLGLVAVSTLLVACSGKQDDKNTLTVGVMTKTDSDQARWDKIEELLKKKILHLSTKNSQTTLNLIRQLQMVRLILMLSNIITS